MAMSKIEMTDAETGQTLVHYDGPSGYDLTLCGDSVEVDTYAASNAPTATKRRVTCERCREIVRYVRGG